MRTRTEGKEAGRREGCRVEGTTGYDNAVRSSRLLDRARFRPHSHAVVKRKWRVEGCRAKNKKREEEEEEKKKEVERATRDANTFSLRR